MSKMRGRNRQGPHVHRSLEQDPTPGRHTRFESGGEGAQSWRSEGRWQPEQRWHRTPPGRKTAEVQGPAPAAFPNPSTGPSCARAAQGTFRGPSAQARSGRGRGRQKTAVTDRAPGPMTVVPPPPPPPRPRPTPRNGVVPGLPAVRPASAKSPVQVTYKSTPRPTLSFLAMLHAALAAKEGEEAVVAAYQAHGCLLAAGPPSAAGRCDSPIGDRIRAA
ncbi:hypothetical protein ACKKBF_B19870 [Auxenochlorella protothecoides x Auxenochlorella symbiontica]